MKTLYTNLTDLWESLVTNIKTESYKELYHGMRYAYLVFAKQIQCLHCEIIGLASLLLLFKYAYTMDSDYGKFTLGYRMKKEKREGETEASKADLEFMIGKSIVFRDDGQDVPVNVIYEEIMRHVIAKAQEYEKYKLERIYIRIYLDKYKMKCSDPPFVSYEDIYQKIIDGLALPFVGKAKEPRKIVNSKRCYPPLYMTSLKPTRSLRRLFIVADLETVLINDVHVPYAAGFLVVKPCDEQSSRKQSIQNFFSEDNQSDSFQSRSTMMLSQFRTRLASNVKFNPSLQTVYFHNFGRFDGIILMEYFIRDEKEYIIKPLMRNRILYQISVYSGKTLV